ncbi:hypothetical protein ART_0707 [Arthrobacter sp. PAMC 25486]|nr:hypothetical protein ART_0707 [Arthrobacter sp. PAMC 25486]
MYSSWKSILILLWLIQLQLVNPTVKAATAHTWLFGCAPGQ